MLNAIGLRYKFRHSVPNSRNITGGKQKNFMILTKIIIL
jgi:hypothetical protein